MKEIVKLVEAYAAANGGVVPRADWACVGEPEDFPAENGYAAEWCHQPTTPEPISGGDDHPVNTAVNNKFKTLVSRMPNSRLPEVDVGYGYKYRGVFYDSSASQNGGLPTLQYHVNGRRDSCPVGIVAYYSTSTTTVCEYHFTGISQESS